jgi:hypothetical protein
MQSKPTNIIYMFSKLKSIQLTLLALAAVLFSHCTKEGPPGPQGEPGTVNIDSYLYTANNWSLNSNSQWYCTIGVPGLTTANIDDAGVLVYFKVATAWRALPYTAVSSTNYFMGFYSYVGTVDVLWTYNGIGSGSDPNDYYNTNVQFKIVVIPAEQRLANPDVDWNDYEAVKQRFNLNDESTQVLN